MRIRASEPESRAEIIGARQKRWVRRRVRDEANWSVVAERHQM